jgi:hypothetical protein
MTPRNERLEAARRYALAGWPVFPVRTGEKVPAVKHGFRDATADVDKITYWWREHPLSNIGIATGAPGPVVLDVDTKAGVNGYAAWNKLQRAGLVDGPGEIVRTPSGGLHAYFQATDQRSGHLAAAGIDYQAAGCYVLAPPSKVGGKSYVLIKHEPSTATVDWLAIRSVLQPETERRPQRGPERGTEPAGDVSRLAGWLTRQPEGNRNRGLFFAANRALEAGHADLEELAEAGRQLGLDEREITATLDSARRTTRPKALTFEPEMGA